MSQVPSIFREHAVQLSQKWLQRPFFSGAWYIERTSPQNVHFSSSLPRTTAVARCRRTRCLEHRSTSNPPDPSRESHSPACLFAAEYRPRQSCVVAIENSCLFCAVSRRSGRLVEVDPAQVCRFSVIMFSPSRQNGSLTLSFSGMMEPARLSSG